MIALDRGPWRRAWVIVVPAIVYLLWYIGWGGTEASTLSFDNVANSPVYILDGFASSLASLFGIGTPTLLGGNGGLGWGRTLLVALGAVVIWGLVRRPRGRSRVLVPLAAGLAFWLLTAANASPQRPPDASRYQFVGAVFILMAAADYLAGQLPDWRPDWRSWWVLAAAFVVAAFATAANFSTLHDTYNGYRGPTRVVRGDLAALEIARDRVDSGFVLTPENSDFEYFGYVVAGLYLSAADEFGSPAYSEEELAEAPEGARAGADKVLAAALPIRLKPLPSIPARRCRTVGPAGGGAFVLRLLPGGATLQAARGVHADLRLRRFASASFPVHVATLRGASRLDIPTDRSRRPWDLQVRTNGKVTMCGQ